MTRYIIKENRSGCVHKTTVAIPNGQHPKTVAPESPLNQFPPGSRIYYESNGQEVGMIYRRKDGSKRVRWHRL